MDYRRLKVIVEAKVGSCVRNCLRNNRLILKILYQNRLV